MGFLDGIKSAFNHVAGGFKSVYDWVSDKLHDGAKAVKSIISTVHDDAKDLVGGVGKIITKTEAAVEHVVEKISENATGAVKSIGGNIEGSVSSLSKAAWPIAIGALAIGGVYLASKA